MLHLIKLSIKAKIILVFSVIMILLVVIMARISYVFVKDIYLQQASEHVKMMSTYMASGLNDKYLDFALPDNNSAPGSYYDDFLQKQVKNSGLASAFVFDNSFNIRAATSADISSTVLKLSESEIITLSQGQSSASFPFADNNGHWYIWGFYRINDHYFLGIQENVDNLKTLNQLSGIFAGIGFAGILMTIFAAWFIARSIAGPVDRLVSFSKKIGSGDFDAQPPDKIYAEFEHLKNTMQQMKTNLSEQNKEREQMLAQIAHEIRNPLGGIELMAGLVKESLPANDKSTQHIQKILDEIQGLKQQLTLFLEYSKPQTANPGKIVIEELITEIRNIFNGPIKEKNIDFTLDNRFEEVLFDYGHLKQTLTNLVANSIDAVEEKGKITISSFSKNGHALLSVENNGPAITEKNQQKIFNPFFTTKASGTGLGLAVCQKLCALNNAEIELDHLYKSGCRFFIKINTKSAGGI